MDNQTKERNVNLIEIEISNRKRGEYPEPEKMSGYPLISKVIYEHFFNDNRYISAIAELKDGKTEGELSHYHRKRLDDGRHMCLRIADHDPDIVKTYLSYTRDKIPSPEKCANICLMFHGTRENKDGKSFSFTKDQILRVQKNEIRKFEDFPYTVYYFTPGYIYDKDIYLLNEALDAWFNGNGKQEFFNPLPSNMFRIKMKVRIRGRNEPRDVMVSQMLNPYVGFERHMIRYKQREHKEDKDLKKKKKTDESLVTVHTGEQHQIIKLADVIVLDDKTGAEIEYGEFVMEKISTTINIPDSKPIKIESEDEEDKSIEDLLDNPDEFANRLKEAYEKYWRNLLT